MAPLQRNSSTKSKKSSTINHPTHPKHPLEEVTNDTEYCCDGCNTSGVGTRYHCSTCSFDLHEHCAKCPDKLSSYVHPRHALILENKASIDRFCDVCGDLVNGLFYSCEECEIDIHPICTLLPLNAKHDLHPQHVLRLQPAKPGWCAVCREICNFWRYRCNICCIDVHPNCVSTRLPDVPSGGGGGGDGSATRGLQPPQPADNKVPSGGHGGDTIRVVPQQETQPYPPVGYAGEVPTGENAIHAQPPTTFYPGAGHGVGVLNSGVGGDLASQRVPHQAPQLYPPSGYAGEVLPGAGAVDTRGIPTHSGASPYPSMGYGVDVLSAGGGGGGLSSQGVPYQAPQSYPMAGYGIDVLTAGGHTGSPRNGIPQQTPQSSYPVSRNGSEVPTASVGGSGSWGIPQPQAEAPMSYPPAGFGIGLPQGSYPMPMMMNPGFPMGMMMAQQPTMVIVHQNYPGQGNNFGMNQQAKQQGNKQKKNEEFDELAQMGKEVKKKMQIAAKYAVGLASAASTSLAGAPVNVANLMKK